MKYALVIPDGCADEPQPDLDGRTPLEAADLPAMDEVARRGITGLADHVPPELPSGSDVGTMSLLGYDPKVWHTGRAPIEAAATGITLGENDWAIRCNLVTVLEGVMHSFTAGQVSNRLAARLVGVLEETWDDVAGLWEFYPGVSYRNLVVYRDRDGSAPFGRTTASTPPHDIIDLQVAGYLPEGPGSEVLRAIMEASERVFADDEQNRLRVDGGGLPVTGVWLWGIGRRPAVQPFFEKFGLHGTVVTAVDLLRGLARLIGWPVVEVAGATGYTDTDYAAKARAAISVLAEVDLVVVHVEATDEASHEGDVAAKVAALEQIDSQIVGPLHDFLEEQGDYRLLVCPDHPTLLRTKTHGHGDVAFAMCGSGIAADDSDAYSEPVAASVGTRLAAGCDLMPLFLDHP